MSTYNGDRFVAHQLHSILDQLPDDGRIIIRDDGSTDRTVQICASIRDCRITLVPGENIGFARSFLTLLRDAPVHADMVMFSDQDDVWLPGKVDRARSTLAQYPDSPALYCSAQMLANADLQPIHATCKWPRRPCFENALSENVVTGCTAALNPAAAELLRQAGVPRRVQFHDWWFYLVVSAFGTVIFDDNPTLLYRQHGSNQIGHGAGWWGRQYRILRFIVRNDWVGILVGQVADLHEHYGRRLDERKAHLLNTYLPIFDTVVRPSWGLVFGMRRWRQYWFGEIAFRVIVAAHLLGLWPLAAMRRRS